MTTTVKDSNHFVSGYKNDQSVKVTIGNQKEKVFISACDSSVITVSGKCAAVCVDKLTKSAVVFEDLIGNFEAVNCQKIQVDAKGTVAQFQIDKVHGAVIFLNSESARAATFVTALSSEINLSVPGKTDDDDPVEYAIPEQFVSSFVNGKLVTKPTEHV